MGQFAAQRRLKKARLLHEALHPEDVRRSWTFRLSRKDIRQAAELLAKAYLGMGFEAWVPPKGSSWERLPAKQG